MRTEPTFCPHSGNLIHEGRTPIEQAFERWVRFARRYATTGTSLAARGLARAIAGLSGQEAPDRGDGG